MRALRQLGRWLVMLAWLAPVVALGQPAQAGDYPPRLAAGASPPPPPPGCVATTHSYTQSSPQPILDFTTITSTISVNGLQPFIWDVQAHTSISHTFPSDLNVYLEGPNEFGFRNTLTTRNGGAHVNSFADTLWTDQAALGVTEVTFANNVSQALLIPEGAMGKHYHHDPNGLWKLIISDAALSDTGTLNSWNLTITTLPFSPIGASQFPSVTPDLAIPDQGTVTSTITVSNAGPLLTDLTLDTDIPHQDSGTLKIVLTSPTGLTTTLTNGASNLAFFADQFEGTTWTDDPIYAPGPVTDAVPVSGDYLHQVQPEGAMRHFAGTDPNGTWKLAVTDLTADGKTGTLHRWSLAIYTGHCDAIYLPVVKK